MDAREQAESLVESLRRDRIGAALFGEAQPTRTIGRFEILGVLGRGGMGEVLDARDPSLDRAVALKLLRHSGGHQPRLLREAQALARLSHPNVVQVYEVGVVEDRPFIAMERLCGQTLAAWQATPRPWSACLAAYAQAGAGLAAAHDEGLIHRDFKPGNCMIDEQGRVRVLDFGLARSNQLGLGSESELPATDETEPDVASDAASMISTNMLTQLLTRSGAMLGTIAYMAPEQLLGAEVDARCDQFGFCVALFEALHGHRPFAGRSGAELLLSIQRGALAPGHPREGLPPVPAALDRVVRRGLALDPAARWPSMHALLDALADVQHARRRRWRWLGAAGLLLGASAIAITGMLVRPREQPCAGLRELEAPAWTGEQRDAVEHALLDVGGARGPELWQVVSRTLDRYAAEWVAARADACEATHVQRSAGPHTLELRLACLDRRMQRMRATVEQLAIIDRPGLAQVAETVQSLPSLSGCNDADALLLADETLSSGEQAQQRRIERLIDEGWALQHAGRSVAAVRQADAAIEQVEGLPDTRSIVAEAHFLRGSLHLDARRSAQARADLQAAFRSAERSRQPELTREILVALVHLEVWSHKVSAAEIWLLMAQARASELAALAEAEGQVLLESGQPEQAVARLQRAIELYRDDNHELELANSLRLLGEACSIAGDADAARTALLESLELAKANAALSMVAKALHDLGMLERDLGRSEQARGAYQRALDLQIELFGEQAPVSMHTHIGLAELALAEGDLHTAEREAVAAQAIANADPTLDPEGRGLLGMLLAAVHRGLDQPATALDDYAWARAAFMAMPEVDHGAVAMADSGMADCLVALGRLDEARVLYQQALATLTEHVEPSHPRWLYPQMGLGHLLVEIGEPDAARPLLERALTLVDADDPAAVQILADIQHTHEREQEND